jgi:hypothetical protein
MASAAGLVSVAIVTPSIAGLQSQGALARNKPPRIKFGFAIRICPMLIWATVS